MKTVVVGGLLGAGKTTFIRNYAGRIPGKTVVLVNDFGKAGIDGEIFSAGGIESIELPSGCVCCTLKFDLITTLKKIRENLRPDCLLIEPSGIASPSGVIDVLEMLGIAPVTVVGIVDVTEFSELYEEQMYGNFFEDQIRTADIILLNKMDLAEAENIAKTRGIIESLNPGTVIFLTVNADVPASLPDVSTPGRTRESGETHLVFDTLSLRLGENVGYEFFAAFFGDISKGIYGEVIRAKALVHTDRGPFRFDLAYGKVEGKIFPQAITDSRLVLIGSNLRREALMSAAGSRIF